MTAKHTILTENRIKDIEDIIVCSGRIVTARDIYKAWAGRGSKFSLKKRINQLKATGWLVPLKRGLYFVADISSRGFVGLSPAVIAAAFMKDSYVSFESALYYHGLFEQMIRTVSSVTCLKTKKYVFQNNIFQYVSIKKKLFFGFDAKNIDGYYANIADLEKVFLDWLYFRSDTFSIDLFVEMMKKAKDRLDLKRLMAYSQNFPQATKRKLGFVLDLLNMDTKKLHQSLDHKGFSRLTPGSGIFNAKWRLYCEDRFIG